MNDGRLSVRGRRGEKERKGGEGMVRKQHSIAKKKKKKTPYRYKRQKNDTHMS